MPLTCIGVPDNKMRRLHERAANAYTSEMFMNLLKKKRTIKQHVLKKERINVIPGLLMSDHFSACAPHHI